MVENEEAKKVEAPQDLEEQSPISPESPQDAVENSKRNNSNNSNKRRNIIMIAIALLVVVGLVIGLTLGLRKSSSSSNQQVDTASASGEKWPHEVSDIPPDPGVKYGSLPNGVRYMIMPNVLPPEKLSIRLHVDAGSVHEDEDQRGLAHFIEHLVFSGTKNFPEVPELIQEMQRLGLYFGAHVNAYTHFMETVYILELPNVQNDTVTTGFAVLRDYADGALFYPEKIEIERGIVLSEDRETDSVEWRIFLKQLSFLLPDYRLPHRLPIGDKDVIRTAPRQRIVDFYRQYYVPERITVVAVGDTTTDKLEEHITDAFESMVQPEDAGADPDMGSLPPKGKGLQAAVFGDKEIVNDNIWLTTIREWDVEADTKANRIKNLPLDLANRLLSRRFDDIANEEGSPIRGGYASRDIFLKLLDWGDIVFAPMEGRWEDAVGVLEQELRRAMNYGFTEGELNEIKANYIFSYEAAVTNSETRESEGYAWDLVDTINGRNVFSTPEVDLEIMQSALEKATLETVHQAFKEYWDTEDLTLFLTSKEIQDDVTPEVLKELFLVSRATVEVTPPEDEEIASFGYADFGPPGTVVSDVTVDDFDIRQIVSSNNVRVNMKQTNFDKGYVGIVARFGTGKLGQPKRPWLDNFAETVMNYGGLGKHSQDEIDKIMADNSVWTEFWVNDDSFDFRAEVLADDLELQLQLMAAHMIDPGYREEAVRLFQGHVPSIMTELAHKLGGALMYVDEWIWGSDERFAVPTKAGLLSFQTSDVNDWLHDQLTSSSIELSLVGDFDPNTVLPLILNTFGALPEREEFPAEVGSEAREISFPPTPSYRTFTYQSKSKRASAIAAFEIPPVKEDVKEYHRIYLLAEIFSNRLWDRIREELGESYSPYAYAAASATFDHGYIWAESEGAPEVTERTSQLLIDIAKNCTEITEDEFIRAKKPLQTLLAESLRDNSYWLYNIIWESQEKPFTLDWARERDASYDSITLEELEVLAAQYLDPLNAVRVDVLPVAKGDDVEEADST